MFPLAQAPTAEPLSAGPPPAGPTAAGAPNADAATAGPRTAEKILSDAVDDVTSLNFSGLDRDEVSALVSEYGVTLGMKVALVLIILTIAWTLAGWAGAVVASALRKARFDTTLTKFLSKLARWLVLLLAGLMCLGYFGVPTTSFAAVIGAAGLAIGLAFQGTLSNFAAGAMLLLFRPFKVGDAVNVADQLGIVDEISIFTTIIDTFDNRRIIIPNGSVFGSVIENITHHPIRRVDGDVGVGYGADIDKTRAVLEEVAAAVPGTTTEKDPAVILLGLGGSSVDWSVRVWAPTSDYLDVKQALLREIKVRLDAAGIEIPFPQMDVHVRDMPST
ncbi:MAG: mechanosensitive ion channel family protein [Planctomycetota bacterium]